MPIGMLGIYRLLYVCLSSVTACYISVADCQLLKINELLLLLLLLLTILPVTLSENRIR